MESQEDKEVVLEEKWWKKITNPWNFIQEKELRAYYEKNNSDFNELITNSFEPLSKFDIGENFYRLKYSDITKKLTLRQLLQQIGDIMLQIHPDWLLNVMFKDYIPDPHPYYDTKIYGDKWIIPDLRKPNEYNKIKELGGKCIKVVKLPTIKEISTDDRPGIGNTSFEVTMEKEWFGHISETALDNETDWDYIIEAEYGDIDSLIKQVKEMLIKFEEYE